MKLRLFTVVDMIILFTLLHCGIIWLQAVKFGYHRGSRREVDIVSHTVCHKRFGKAGTIVIQ
jgi:hypothetical protein